MSCNRRRSALGRALVPLVIMIVSPVHAHAAVTPARDLGHVYLSPAPGAQWVSPWNDIVLRPGPEIDAASLPSAAMSVVGSRSGEHRGTLVLSDDGRTIVFTPSRPFVEGESATVTLAGVRASHGAPVHAVRFSFSITSRDPKRARALMADETTGRLVPADRFAPGGPLRGSVTFS